MNHEDKIDAIMVKYDEAVAEAIKQDKKNRGLFEKAMDVVQEAAEGARENRHEFYDRYEEAYDELIQVFEEMYNRSYKYDEDKQLFPYISEVDEKEPSLNDWMPSDYSC